MAFHPYPQLIPQLFNVGGFGPPLRFSSASPWPWIDHSVSGLQTTTLRPLQTRFPCGFASYMLNLAAIRNSPVRSTKSTPSGLNALRLLVGTRFQVLFHSPPGVLFTFPSRYSSLSVARWYLALERGRPSFTRGFSCPVLLTDRSGLPFFSPTGLSPSMVQLSNCLD